jgi:hypothetical protein
VELPKKILNFTGSQKKWSIRKEEIFETYVLLSNKPSKFYFLENPVLKVRRFEMASKE